MSRILLFLCCFACTINTIAQNSSETERIIEIQKKELEQPFELWRYDYGEQNRLLGVCLRAYLKWCYNYCGKVSPAYVFFSDNMIKAIYVSPDDSMDKRISAAKPQKEYHDETPYKTLPDKGCITKQVKKLVKDKNIIIIANRNVTDDFGVTITLTGFFPKPNKNQTKSDNYERLTCEYYMGLRLKCEGDYNKKYGENFLLDFYKDDILNVENGFFHYRLLDDFEWACKRISVGSPEKIATKDIINELTHKSKL